MFGKKAGFFHLNDIEKLDFSLNQLIFFFYFIMMLFFYVFLFFILSPRFFLQSFKLILNVSSFDFRIFECLILLRK